MQTQTGTVKWVSFGKGYGFIKPDDSDASDFFVHISAVEGAGLERLEQDDRVTYELVQSRDGRPKAMNLQLGRLPPEARHRLAEGSHHIPTAVAALREHFLPA